MAVKSNGRVRPHELVFAAYFAVTALLIALLGLPDRSWVPLLLLHVGLVAVLMLVMPLVPERGIPAFLRAWLPVLALPLVYKEVQLLNTLFVEGYHDATVQGWELALFGSQAAVTLREALPWKPLSEYLHFGYFGYYALFPALGGALWLAGRREDYHRALTITLGTFLACYLVFIMYPVAGPWYHFPRPVAEEVGWVFPGLIHTVLEHGAARGAAFPSSHAAAAVAIWLAAWVLHRRVFFALSAIVPALVVGTVYGGFHYAVDAVAGVLAGILCFVMFGALHTRLSARGGTEAPPADPHRLPDQRDRTPAAH